MTRTLRFLGVVAFAFLFGLSANVLKGMYDSGQLFETYNSDRKAYITLLCFSFIGFSSLLALELALVRRKKSGRRFGEVFHQKTQKDCAENFGDIYAGHKTDENQPSKRSRSSRSYPGSKTKTADHWQLVLRTSCLIVPFLYTFVYINHAVRARSGYTVDWMDLGIFTSLIAFSAATVVGVHRKKLWGYVFAYVLVMLNLLLFPVGTMLGLVMLLALSGTTTFFDDARRVWKKNRKMKRAAKRMRASAV